MMNELLVVLNRMEDRYLLYWNACDSEDVEEPTVMEFLRDLIKELEAH